MHVSAFLMLLPVAALAQQQPFVERGLSFTDRLKSLWDDGFQGFPSFADAGASKVAGQIVQPLTRSNYDWVLAPQLDREKEFLLYVTGGNRSCFGNCRRANQAWNLSVPVLASLPSNPQLGSLDCEVEEVLCTALSTGLPSVWHFKFPQKPASPTAETPPTSVHIIQLNTTTVTSEDIVKIVRDQTYLDRPEYDGILHPVDGAFHKYGVLVPFGWLMWGFGSTPSWLIMIGISFFSRQWVARRQQANPNFGMGAPRPAGGAAAPAAPAPAVGAGRSAAGKKKNR